MIQFIKNYLWHLPKAVAASARYGFPARKLTVIGVTGTKGKTTTAHLIFHLLKGSGARIGLISTIGAFFSAKGGEEIDTGLHVTTPAPQELQKLLRMAVDRGLTHLVLEVTSNGLDQFRVWGIKFKISVITNIYPDHLDYHGTMEQYVSAKAKIIRQSKMVALPKNSPYFSELNRAAEAAKARVITVRYRDPSPPRCGFGIPQNGLMAMAVVKVLGISETEAKKALKSFKGVKGRLEAVYRNKFLVVIDFAHTPESLEVVLMELRTSVKKNGRLIVVFGCAGERDRGRRRMGAVAAKRADCFIITAEDPRSETVEEISEEIAGWAVKAGAREIEVYETSGRKFTKLPSAGSRWFVRIPDRQEAINYAIHLAKEDDVVGLFGKGHEKSMCYGKEEKPWSEHEAVKIALTKRTNLPVGNATYSIAGRQTTK